MVYAISTLELIGTSPRDRRLFAMDPISISSALEDRVVEPTSRRVFLPVAPSFARKLVIPDDLSSVDSFDDRRYSDVPSARSLTAFRRASPLGSAVPPTAGTGAAAGVGAGIVGGSASRAGSSPIGSGMGGMQPPPSPAQVPVRPQPVRVSLLSSPPPQPKSRRSWRRLLPRLRGSGSSSNEDRERPEDRRTTCLPRKPNRRSRVGTTASDRPRSSGNGNSFARLPKLGAVDVSNEPHSFAGFRQKPWYLVSEEGSSVSSSEWDVSVRAPSSLESRHHRLR